MPTYHTPSPSPSPTRRRPYDDRRRSPSPSRSRSRGEPARARPYNRSISRSPSRSWSRSSSRSRSWSRDRGGWSRSRSRPGDDRRLRRYSRSRSRSRSSSPSSRSRRSYDDYDDDRASSKARKEKKKENKRMNEIKASAGFLGAVAAASYAAHKLWPKGTLYGGKEEWETRPIRKIKEELEDKRDDSRKGIEKATGKRTSSTTESSSVTAYKSERRDPEPPPPARRLPGPRPRDDDRVYYESREGRRCVAPGYSRRENGGPAPSPRVLSDREVVLVDREGRVVDATRARVIYDSTTAAGGERVSKDEVRYMSKEDPLYKMTVPPATEAPPVPRLVGRKREEILIRQPPPPVRSERSSRSILMLEDGSDRLQDAGRLLDDARYADDQDRDRRVRETHRHEELVRAEPRREILVSEKVQRKEHTRDLPLSPRGWERERVVDWERQRDPPRERR